MADYTLPVYVNEAIEGIGGGFFSAVNEEGLKRANSLGIQSMTADPVRELKWVHAKKIIGYRPQSSGDSYIELMGGMWRRLTLIKLWDTAPPDDFYNRVILEAQNYRDYLDTIGIWKKPDENIWTEYVIPIATVTAGIIAVPLTAGAITGVLAPVGAGATAGASIGAGAGASITAGTVAAETAVTAGVVTSTAVTGTTAALVEVGATSSGGFLSSIPGYTTISGALSSGYGAIKEYIKPVTETIDTTQEAIKPYTDPLEKFFGTVSEYTTQPGTALVPSARTGTVAASTGKTDYMKYLFIAGAFIVGALLLFSRPRS